MFYYPPPIRALDSSFPSPGLLCATQDTSIDDVIPVDNITPAPHPNKLQGLSNVPGPSIPYNLDISSGGPLKAKNSKRIRSSISKGVVRKRARRIECKLYQKSYRNRAYLSHRQLKSEATNTSSSPHTSTTTLTAASVQTLQLPACPNSGASELNFTTGNPVPPLADANLDFAGFDFTSIDIDELSAAFDTQALAPPDDFDFSDFDITGTSDRADHTNSDQETNEGGVFANPGEFGLRDFDFGGMLDTSTLDTDSQAPGCSHLEDQWNDPELASSVDAVLTIGAGTSSIECSVKGLYYPGSNVFVPIDLNVFSEHGGGGLKSL